MKRAPTAEQLESILADLEKRGTQAVRDGMARYAIPSDTAFGVSVGTLKTMAKAIGQDHALAQALWKSGRYEARMLAAFVDEPERVTVAQMDAWCRDFDNWAVCDHACFHLFDRTPHAFGRVAAWAERKGEFERRAAFALLSSLALHQKSATDAEFLAALPHIEAAATDDRNFVKKAVSWALRSIGRRGPGLQRSAVTLAKRLAASEDAAARWVGKDALRDLGRLRATRDKAEKERKSSSRSALQRSSGAGVIDEYLARLKPEPRAALERLRSLIKSAAPKAEECVSYGLPAFRQDGPLVAFGATPKHCAFYPMSDSVVGSLASELREFDTSKGTIRFQPDHPLPADLVKKIVRARIKQNADS